MSDDYDGDDGGSDKGSARRRLPRTLILGLAWIASTLFVVSVLLRHMQHEGLLNDVAVEKQLRKLDTYRESLGGSGGSKQLTASGKKASDPGLMETLDLDSTKASVLARIETWLPYASEGGLMLLLGLGLGIASRMFVKLALLMVLLFFVGLQYFAYEGLMHVHWGDLATWLEQTVLNSTVGADWVAVLKAKVPAAGATGVGYFLGLRS